MRKSNVISVLLLVLLVIGAGCIGNSGAPAATSTTSEIPSTHVPTTTQTATATAEPTTTQPDNPWRSDTLVIGIENQTNDTRNYRPMVKEAIRYWNNNTTVYTPYNVSLVLDEDAESPDVVINFTDGDIPTSYLSIGDLLGSAPVTEPDDRVYSTDTIYIKAGYNNTSTVETITHEFGHYLGLEHGDEPMPLMAEYGAASRLPMPNATERPIGWKSTNLTVYVSVHNMDTSDVNTQVEHALRYYESGAEGWMESNVTFSTVNNRTDADIIIEIYNSDVNTDDLDDDGSIGWRYGNDPDGDQVIEYYTSSQITVGGIEEEAVGWHVGSWLAYSLGGKNADDVPEPFKDADYDDRRNWWR